MSAHAAGLTALSPLPLHTQIREALRRGILDGTYREHSQLPSESELTAAYGVSRITVRHSTASEPKTVRLSGTFRRADQPSRGS